MRDDLAVVINQQRALKTAFEEDRVEYHQVTHEAQTLKNTKLDARLDALEDILSLPDQPQPRQVDQREILRALLLTANGMWVPAKDVRRKMKLGKDEFSKLLKMSMDFVEIKENPRDRRQRLIKIS